MPQSPTFARPLSRRTLLASLLAAGGASLLPASAQAALAVGALAPDFTVDAALGGQPFKFTLSQALKQGPVVLYFYPKAFTSGCTVEAHLFAEATPQFKALGATVIGLSNDTLETVKKFSTEACRSAFAVGADDGAKVIKAYDAGLMLIPGMADRVSFVIAPDRKILHVYSSLSPEGHITETMKAVQAWRSAQR